MVDLSIDNYDASTNIFHVPLCEKGGPTVYDTVGTANGTISTGAGGLTTFWSGDQDAYHYFATDGGTKGIYCNGTDNTGLGLTASPTGSFSVVAWVSTD